MTEYLPETEPHQNNAVRLFADYQLMSDEPPLIWADMVLGHAKDLGAILDFKVLATGDGPYGLAYLSFTVDVPFRGPFRTDMDGVQAKEAGETWLNALIGDSDVSCRFATGIFREAS